MKEIFTTHDVAKICRVDITSVINWVKSGKIKAYKTPGGHRRIKREDLVSFLKEYNFPASEDLLESSTTVLVVEDDEAMRDFIKTVVSKNWPDFKIYEAEDGFAAGKLIAEKKPDVVILDIKLPGIDGVEVCKLIKKDPSLTNTKIMAVTGYSNQETKDKIINAGANEYIEKPLNKDKLIKILDKLIEQ